MRFLWIAASPLARSIVRGVARATELNREFTKPRRDPEENVD